MSRHEPRLPRRDDGPAFDEPAFDEPWQAQLFALTVALSERGHFTWPQWAEAFSGERRRSAETGLADAPGRYFLDWLTALEAFLAARGLAELPLLAALKEDWAAAYRATPHGEPVVRTPKGGTAAAGRKRKRGRDGPSGTDSAATQ